MDILEKSHVFLPATALIVVILLVWAQLQASFPRVISNKVGRDDENAFTLHLGSAWLYLAILFALVAFALHVFKSCEYAVGFFGLSFLMAVSSVFLAFVRTLVILFKPEYKGVAEDKKLLIMAFVAAFGLGLFSFSLAFGIFHWWNGVLSVMLIVIAGAYAIWKISKSTSKK